VRAQFEAQRLEILGNLNAWRFNKAYNAKDARQDKKAKLAGLIAWSMATTALSDAMYPLLYQLMVETGQDAISQVGMDPSQFNPISSAVTGSARAQANKAAQSVNDETEKQLRATLGQGIDAGETTDELLARVEQVMGSALTMRTARISDSEAYRAMGKADIEAWTQSGKVTGKEWYTAKDERVCNICNSLDGTIIAIDKPFYQEGDVITVGKQTLNISYESVDAPPAHVSCRCVALDVDLT
jgi:SPP1 gp7 family putative phage head morphogenesis protein